MTRLKDVGWARITYNGLKAQCNQNDIYSCHLGVGGLTREKASGELGREQAFYAHMYQ